MAAVRHARGLGRIAALALCCLLAADEDASARRAHKPKAKPAPAPLSEFTGKPNPARADPLPRHAFRAGCLQRDRRLGGGRSRRRLCDVPGKLPCDRRQREDVARYAPGLSGAGRDLPQGARRRNARGGACAKVLRGEFSCGAGRQDRGSERLPHRLLRADRRRLAHPDRRFQGAALRPPARSRAHGAQAQGRELSQQRPGGAAHRARQIRAVLRPRRDRGRRARDARSGDLLSQGRQRSAVRPDPGLGARAPHRRQPAARQLRRAQWPALYAGRPHPDRAQHHLARRHVDGPHPQVDGGESGRRKGTAAAEQVLCVLPQHRSAGERGGEGCAGRAADRRRARSRSTARCTSTARRSSSRATCRSRPKHRTRNSAG